jgi:hypothetical protein
MLVLLQVQGGAVGLKGCLMAQHASAMRGLEIHPNGYPKSPSSLNINI